ncbi:hypothetical protein KCP71_25845 [Salmonella enterica subsp. enterica]|nr:hypothetical protein KCP71_25845 [Salmonella enterica subsp. enterica]
MRFFGEGGFVTNVTDVEAQKVCTTLITFYRGGILVYAKTGQGALRLEPLSKEYIQKSIKNRPNSFPKEMATSAVNDCQKG